VGVPVGFAVGVVVGADALQSAFDPRPNVDAAGATLPVTTTL
jgi:hypothetical protein